MTCQAVDRVEEFRSTVLARHVEAAAAFVHGDPRPWIELWSRRDPVTLWFERFHASIAGRAVEPVTVRVTHIYRREGGGWRVVHRHGDNPGHDPRVEDDDR